MRRVARVSLVCVSCSPWELSTARSGRHILGRLIKPRSLPLLLGSRIFPLYADAGLLVGVPCFWGADKLGGLEALGEGPRLNQACD